MDLLEQARQIINETDDKMRSLFVRRMEAVRMVAEYKKQHGLPILDEAREEKVVRLNSQRVEDPELREKLGAAARKRVEELFLTEAFRRKIRVFLTQGERT